MEERESTKLSETRIFAMYLFYGNEIDGLSPAYWGYNVQDRAWEIDRLTKIKSECRLMGRRLVLTLDLTR
jgi:hypothetical protein